MATMNQLMSALRAADSAGNSLSQRMSGFGISVTACSPTPPPSNACIERASGGLYDPR